MKTVFLDPSTWDAVLDSSGNPIVVDASLAVAQDVASAARVFKGEMWYDSDRGVPYLSNDSEQVFGSFSPAFLSALVNVEALTVPEVDEVRTLITGFSGRRVTGQIQIIDTTGATQNVHF